MENSVGCLFTGLAFKQTLLRCGYKRSMKHKTPIQISKFPFIIITIIIIIIIIIIQ